MPAPLSEKERESILLRLRTSAQEFLLTTGVRKTSVDDLVRRAGIPKGTFYLFYKCKETLFFEVISAFHEVAENELSQKLSAAMQMPDGITAEKLTTIIVDLFRMTDESFFPQIIQNGDLEYLMRKLPDEVVVAHQKEDEERFSFLLNLFPLQGQDDAQKERLVAMTAAFRLLFTTLLYKREASFGNSNGYYEALTLLVRGLVKEMMNV